MNKFLTRTLSATVYAALFLGSIYSGRLLGDNFLGHIILAAFLLFVTVGCTFEFFRMVGLQDSKPCRFLGYAYAALTTLGLALVNILPAIMVIWTIILPIAFALAVIVQLWYHSEQPFREAAYTLVPMLYIALPLGLMFGLHFNFNVLVMCIIMVWVNDSFAYMGGSLVGKHKMWVRHSPGKTWEGTAIGVAGTIALALLVGPLFKTSLLWYDWLVLGIICSVVDTLGDLVESMLKRSVGVKDSGKIMPGHGGFLDRFDSLLIVVPFVWVYLYVRFSIL